LPATDIPYFRGYPMCAPLWESKDLLGIT